MTPRAEPRRGARAGSPAGIWAGVAAARLAALALAGLAWGPCASALSLDLPPGATLAFEAVESPGRHALATGPAADGAVPLERREGTVTRQAWQVPLPEASPEAPTPDATLALLRPLRAQAEAEGLRVLLDCDARSCGGFDFRSTVEVLPPPAMFVDLGDFRYLAAEGGGRSLSLLVSRSDALGFVQAIEVAAGPATPPSPPGPDAATVPPPETAPDMFPGTPPETPPDPASLGARLVAEGRVVLEGVTFASGSADVSGGEAALGALAAWLAEDPARRVAIVGHTDATGPLSANLALSRRRAEAVARRLLAAPGVAPAQVEADGAGFLAPRATNLTPEGREANRRVEAVALPGQ